MKAYKLTPVQLLTLGYFLISFAGGIILSLPISSSTGTKSPFIDALFSATSAITTTGLITVDTGSNYNFFGQSIILFLFQIGGLGYMLFFVSFALILGTKLSMQDNVLLNQSLKPPFKSQALNYTKKIVFYTIFIESIGTIVLYFLFIQSGNQHIFFTALFHAISAFNTAGFSVFSENLVQYKNNIGVNLIIIFLFTSGCMGFSVVFETFNSIINVLKNKRPLKISQHTKMIYLMASILFISGFLGLYFIEFANKSYPFKEKLIYSLFQTLSSASTTGFNSISINKMKDSSLLIIIFLMFIGAGPGSTAGGIKMSTLGVLLAYTLAALRNKNQVNFFKRSIDREVIRQSIGIFFLAFFWLLTATFILNITENHGFMKILFEVTSAIGTVGLSTGITSKLTLTGKLIIILTMLIGRIGPLGIGLSIVREKQQSYQYPVGDIYVG